MAAPVIVIVDDNKDKENNGVILSGVSAVVGIVPVVFVVDYDNDNEDNGIILLRMALLEPKRNWTLQLFLGFSNFFSPSLEDKETAPKKCDALWPKMQHFCGVSKEHASSHWPIGRLFKYWLAFGRLNVSRPLT